MSCALGSPVHQDTFSVLSKGATKAAGVHYCKGPCTVSVRGLVQKGASRGIKLVPAFWFQEMSAATFTGTSHVVMPQKECPFPDPNACPFRHDSPYHPSHDALSNDTSLTFHANYGDRATLRSASPSQVLTLMAMAPILSKPSLVFGLSLIVSTGSGCCCTPCTMVRWGGLIARRKK